MSKQTWVKSNNEWKKVKSAWVKVNGTWKKDVMPKGVVSGGWKEFMSYIKYNLDYLKYASKQTYYYDVSEYLPTTSITQLGPKGGHFITRGSADYVGSSFAMVIDAQGNGSSKSYPHMHVDSYNGEYVYGTLIKDYRRSVVKTDINGRVILTKELSSDFIAKIVATKDTIYIIKSRDYHLYIDEYDLDFKYKRQVKMFYHKSYGEYELEYDIHNELFYEIYSGYNSRIVCRKAIDDNDENILWTANVDEMTKSRKYISIDYAGMGIGLGIGSGIVNGTSTNVFTKYANKLGDVYQMSGGIAGAVKHDVYWTKESPSYDVRLRLYDIKNKRLIKTHFMLRKDSHDSIGDFPITSIDYVNSFSTETLNNGSHGIYLLKHRRY